MAVSQADNAAQENVVTIDRRSNDRRDEQIEVTETNLNTPTRRKKQRRRHIDPTTCERDYNDQEIEFMRAMDDYKRDSGRMFPTCSEVLEVIRNLGYVQLNDEQREVLGFDINATEAVEEDASENEEEALIG